MNCPAPPVSQPASKPHLSAAAPANPATFLQANATVCGEQFTRAAHRRRRCIRSDRHPPHLRATCRTAALVGNRILRVPAGHQQQRSLTWEGVADRQSSNRREMIMWRVDLRTFKEESESHGPVGPAVAESRSFESAADAERQAGCCQPHAHACSPVSTTSGGIPRRSLPAVLALHASNVPAGSAAQKKPPKPGGFQGSIVQIETIRPSPCRHFLHIEPRRAIRLR